MSAQLPVFGRVTGRGRHVGGSNRKGVRLPIAVRKRLVEKCAKGRLGKLRLPDDLEAFRDCGMLDKEFDREPLPDVVAAPPIWHDAFATVIYGVVPGRARRIPPLPALDEGRRDEDAPFIALKRRRREE